MGIRRSGRIIAFQSIYRFTITQESIKEILDFSWCNREYDKDVKVFARDMIIGVIENLEFIDKIIINYLENWQFERVSLVDKAILRLGVYSLKYQKDIPPKVTINEAVDIAKKFGTQDSYRFINGILDSINKDLAAEAQKG